MPCRPAALGARSRHLDIRELELRPDDLSSHVRKAAWREASGLCAQLFAPAASGPYGCWGFACPAAACGSMSGPLGHGRRTLSPRPASATRRRTQASKSARVPSRVAPHRSVDASVWDQASSATSLRNAAELAYFGGRRQRYHLACQGRPFDPRRRARGGAGGLFRTAPNSSSVRCLRRACAKWRKVARAAGKPVIAFSTDTRPPAGAFLLPS